MYAGRALSGYGMSLRPQIETSSFNLFAVPSHLTWYSRIPLDKSKLQVSIYSWHQRVGADVVYRNLTTSVRSHQLDVAVFAAAASLFKE